MPRAKKAIAVLDDEDLFCNLQAFIGNRLERLHERQQNTRRAGAEAPGTVSA